LPSGTGGNAVASPTSILGIVESFVPNEEVHRGLYGVDAIVNSRAVSVVPRRADSIRAESAAEAVSIRQADLAVREFW